MAITMAYIMSRQVSSIELAFLKCKQGRLKRTSIAHISDGNNDLGMIGCPWIFICNVL